MKHWSRNDKFAFVGVLLAVIGLASALFGQEIRRGLGLDPPLSVSQPSEGAVAPAGQPGAAPLPPAPPQAGGKSAASAMTVTVTGDGNTIRFQPSGVINPDSSYTVEGDSGTSDFQIGPKQTVSLVLKGDGNTIRVAAKIKDRVTIVDSGDGNKVSN